VLPTSPHWLLVIGYWLPTSPHWLLVIGYWLLNQANQQISNTAMKYINTLNMLLISRFCSDSSLIPPYHEATMQSVGS